MRRIGIIGGGRFGSTVAQCLAEKGLDVLFMDRDADVVERMSGIVGKAVQGDAADGEALAEAGFASCDTAVVAMGSNLEASILAAMALKDLRVPRVIAKAATDVHGKVLERVGVDEVVYPEKDRAIGLAWALAARSVLDYVEVTPGSGVVEMGVPNSLVGQTLAGSRIRNTYGLTVLAIHKAASGEEGHARDIVSPSGDDLLEAGDTLVLFGTDENLRRFELAVRT